MVLIFWVYKEKQQINRRRCKSANPEWVVEMDECLMCFM